VRKLGLLWWLLISLVSMVLLISSPGLSEEKYNLDNGLVPPSLDLVQAANLLYETEGSANDVELASSEGPALDLDLAGLDRKEEDELEDIPLEPPELGAEEETLGIYDPLEPINRLFFHFNDKLYFWVLKPVARGYAKVVPKPVRARVKNFFLNLAAPIRMVNCLLQGKFKSASNELVRLIVNTTVGALGLEDVAKEKLDLPPQQEDLGQTLGRLGLGPGIFINWPFFGPSSLRDSVGMLGDFFLDPINYLAPSTKENLTVKGYKTVNKTSLTIGEYEKFKNAALDPYVSMREAYYQYRKEQIKN